MSAHIPVASDVTFSALRDRPAADDPITKLFFDHTMPSGLRLLAVAEPVHRTMHGYLTAGAALAAFEEALVVAVNGGVESGLVRAFAAANQAVRSANQLTVVDQRAFAGITAVIIEGQTALVGYVPPGQALLIQDRRLYGVPDLSSWLPGYMPDGIVEAQEPLGLRCTVIPLLRRTAIREGDRLMIGTSVVGRILAGRELTLLADAPETAVVEQLEEALAAADLDDTYAAWIRFDADPNSVAKRHEHMHEMDRVWKGQSTQPFSAVHLDDERTRAVQVSSSTDRLHTRIIEMSERVFGRSGLDTLPLGATRRSDVPYGAILDRGRARKRTSAPSGWRAWLPRGMHISRRELIGFVLVIAMAASILYGRDIRQARAAKQDRYLGSARTELTLAADASDNQVQLQHLDAAERAITEAIEHGTKASEVEPWQHKLAKAKDEAAGIQRLSSPTQIVELPKSAKATEPKLIFTSGHLYLIAGSVYEVGLATNELTPILNKGKRVDNVKVHAIVDATVDGGLLLVSDGISLFQLNADGSWTVNELPDRDSGTWTGSATGAFKGNYYLLDPDKPAIDRFAAGTLDQAPEDWLTDSQPELANSVDMVIDGNIRVLLADGTVETFYRGKVKGTLSLGTPGSRAHYVGLASNSNGTQLYAVISRSDGASFVVCEIASGTVQEVASLTSWHAGYDSTANKALSNATDFAVDPSTGTLYVVAPSGVWKAAVPTL